MLKERQFSRMQRDQVSSLLSTAVEFSPDTRLGSKAQLRVPAAVRWLHIAGNDFKRICAADTERMQAGELSDELRRWRGL
jgi:hypothetical protein